MKRRGSFLLETFSEVICLATWCRQQANPYQRLLERKMEKGKFEKGRKTLSIFIKEQNVKMLRSEWDGG